MFECSEILAQLALRMPRLLLSFSDSASEMANAGNLPKGMDLAGGVVRKKIRPGVFWQRATGNPDEKGAHGPWQGHDCRDLTADSS